MSRRDATQVQKRSTSEPQITPDRRSEDASDFSTAIMSTKAATRGKRKRKSNTASLDREVVPDVFQEMLADALPMHSSVPERPLKKRRTGRRDSPKRVANPVESHQ